MEKIVCPVCQSKEIDFFYEKNSCKLYRCFSCKLIFVWPVPTNLVDLYSAPYFQRDAADKTVNKFGYVNYEDDKNAMRGTFKIYLKKISKATAGRQNRQAGRKIFDVGAATGYFLDLARQQGFETSGVEISEYAAAVAKKRGHNIILGNLENLAINEKYDAVTMWDVLEHLPKPGGYLKIINTVLNQDGILAINTIDSGSFWARLWGRHWHAILPPEHLFYYSIKNLKILLANSGFKIIERSKIGKQFTLSYIFKVLSHRYNLPALNKLSIFFNRPGFKISLPVNLRDNMFIIARKEKCL